MRYTDMNLMLRHKLSPSEWHSSARPTGWLINMLPLRHYFKRHKFVSDHPGSLTLWKSWFLLWYYKLIPATVTEILRHEKDTKQDLLLETESEEEGSSSSDKDAVTNNLAMYFLSHTSYLNNLWPTVPKTCTLF